MEYNEIVEVVRRSEQGFTKPYICVSENQAKYFVKGRSATRKGQINELICAKLADQFELPIANHQIVEVPEEIMSLSTKGLDLADLGVGPAFGSEAVLLSELTYASIEQVPVSTQQDVLIFDWWVRNGDRCLSERGGNPNLFWNPIDSELVVIDHNLAFENGLNKQEFAQSHVFKNEVTRSLSGDFFRKGEFEGRMTAALGIWDAILLSIPEEWLYIDTEMTIPTDYDFDGVKNLLNEHKQEAFWNWQ